MRRQLMWTLALRGVSALLFGIVALMWPQVTVPALAFLFGVYALVDGATLLTSALRGEGDGERRLAHALGGVLGIVTGVVAIAWPGVTALTLVALVGGWAVATGVAEIWAAVRFRRELHHEWLLFLAGAASVVAGALLWARPDTGAVAIAQLLGVYALICGALVLLAARRLQTTTAASPAHRARHA